MVTIRKFVARGRWSPGSGATASHRPRGLLSPRPLGLTITRLPIRAEDLA